MRKRFKINRYLSLRLRRNETVIYVNKKRFIQCKYLLIDIPVKDVREFDKIDSIDEVAEKLNNILENSEKKFLITPKTEFWGHCSNLQAWYESCYNTCMLHRNLSFPLLKKLTEAGDPLAKRVFKEEIAVRFMNGHLPVIVYLLENNYLDNFSLEDFKYIIRPDFSPNIWYELIKFFFNNNDLNRAIEVIKRILELKPNHENIWDIVSNYLELKKFKEILKTNSNSNIWFQLAEIYLNKKEFGKAEILFKQYLKENSECEYAWEQIGLIYSINKKNNRAIEAFKRVLELNPDNNNAFTQLGHLYCSQQKFEKAIKFYKLIPNNVYVMIHLGIAYIKKGDIDKAIEIYKRAFNINPNSFFIWSKLHQVFKEPHFIGFVNKILKESSEIFKQNFLEILYLKLKKLNDNNQNEIYRKISNLSIL